MTILQTILAGVNALVRVNENFEAVAPAGLFGKRHAGTSGLTWAYYGGYFAGTTVSDGAVALTPSATNYIVARRSDGAVSASTATTNWNDAARFIRLYAAVTDATSVTSYTDARQITGSAAAPRDGVTALASAAGVVDIDCARGDYFTLALTEDVTSITFSNLPGSGKGASLMVRITQDATARTVAWPASFKWASGDAGSVSTGSGAVDLLAITTFDNGTTWRATLAKDFA